MGLQPGMRATKQACTVLVIMSLAVAAVRAQGSAMSTIADNESGTNQNNLGAYWYVYDDSEDGGNSVVTNATKKADGTYDWAPAAGEGNPAGTPGYGALLTYQMGDVQPVAQGLYPYGNMVGIGTQLAPDGEVADITGATKISFWAKATEQMTVRIEVATAVVTDNAYHRTEETIGTSWAQYEIILTQGLGIEQPAWTTDPKDFDPTSVEKIQWQISMDDQNPTSGTLYLDDIKIDLEITPWDMCTECVGAAAQNPTPGLLTDFDTPPTNQNAYGFFAYCYNDAENRAVSTPGTEFSDIYGGVTVNAMEPTAPTIKIEGNGQTGNGAFIEFQLGPTFEENGEIIEPFVGVGTGLHNEVLGEGYFNAAQNGATGLYFDYKTTGEAPWVRFEVKTSQVFPNAGIVHYVKLPKTDGVWKGATVPFEKLVLPRWEDVTQLPPSLKQIDKTALAKLQWAVQGAQGLEGSLAIDNVYFLGMTSPVSPVGSAIVPRQSISRNGVALKRVGDHIDVRFTMPAHTSTAAAELLSLNGSRIAHATIRGAGAVAAQLPLNRKATPAGVYIVRLEAAGVSVVSTPVTITR